MVLFLNDIAGSEILLVIVFILIFFGPKSIPSIAKTFGKAIYQIKQASNDIQNEIKKGGLDIKKDLNIRETIKEVTDEIQIPLDQQMVEMENIVNYNAPRKTHKEPNVTPLPDELKKTSEENSNGEDYQGLKN
ncbi:MAG: Sec-independent protein translocase subunit TatA/TatB [Crocinitomicaceae bacterium]